MTTMEQGHSTALHLDTAWLAAALVTFADCTICRARFHVVVKIRLFQTSSDAFRR
jgi:hypothetical protein